MRIYLDIDGVLLGKGGSIPQDIQAFLAFVTETMECYWLTTHCKGDARTAVRYLARYYPEGLLSLLSAIQPTTWDTLKTEGIDFSTPFVWLDDQPMQAELRVLAQHHCADCLWIVNLSNEPQSLRQFISRFQSLIGS